MEERISIFDIFKIGVGPSSSHTLGPWRAALMLLDKLKKSNLLVSLKDINVYLYGSLAKTGHGHGTDVAVMLGLTGADPETFPTDKIYPTLDEINQSNEIYLGQEKKVPFNQTINIHFLYSESLPFHPNALTFVCNFEGSNPFAETYYSIGGGFVVQEHDTTANNTVSNQVELPFPIDNSKDLLHWGIKTGLSIAEIVYENEQAWRSTKDTEAGIQKIYQTMRSCIYRGCHTQGKLPGGLDVTRRAFAINKKLLNTCAYNNVEEWMQQIKMGGNTFSYTLDWVNCFALAVNEENASFSRVVTAPTNGAAGVIPAVLFYFILFCNGDSEDKINNFLACAAEIGSIFKKGATISAAMGGCQAEIGVSSAMAAAALTESLGGSVRQALMAAEIAMEHHLGLTCDPVKGLVQIPCIERNAMGAMKSITAAQLALLSNPDKAKVSLDNVVRTMWETALDMNTKYKETSDGGLAVNIPLGLSEC